MRQGQSTFFILLLFISLHADTIRSVPQGGTWSDTLTWEGNAVPGDSDDVIIRGTISIVDSAVCHDLTISDSAVLQNGDSAQWVTLRVLGSIVNNDTLRDNPSVQGLQVEVHGDATNNGIWTPGKTYFASKQQQILSQNFTGEFGGALFKRDISGVSDTFPLVAGSELWINASVFDCGRDTGASDSWGRLDMDGNYLNLIGATRFERARVANAEMFSCFDSTAIKSCEFENQTKLNGVITLLDSKVTFNGYTCILGTLLNDSAQERITVRFNGTLSNNEGHIRNHQGGGTLWLDARGDMINFGVWEPARTCIASIKKQSISQFPGTEFRGDFYKRDPAGTSDTFPLVAGSDLAFSKGTFDCAQDTANGSRLGKLDLSGYCLVLQEGNRLTGAYVSGAAKVSCLDASAVGRCSFEGALMLGGCFTVADSQVYFNDTVTVQDTLQSDGDRGTVLLHAAGGIINRGLIRNSPAGSELHIEIGRDIRNVGQWINAVNIFIDSAAQTIALDSSNTITARFSFDAVWASGPYVWYKDEQELGDTSRFLDLDSLIASSAGVYRCKRDTTWSRTITVVYDSSTGVMYPRIHAARKPAAPGMKIIMGSVPFVRFQTSFACLYSLCVYDIVGREISTQASAVSSGVHVVPLARTRLVPGTYIITLSTGMISGTERVLISR